MSFDLSVLVTGANGFVGKSLCLALFEDGHALRAAVRGANRQVENCEAVSGLYSIDLSFLA